MVDYCDIDNSWSFNEFGDLELTTDYGQSISNRVSCPRDFLNIYYEDYGSDLEECLGEHFEEESVRFYLEEALKQDSQIVTYEIMDINLVDGEVIAELIVDGVELSVNLTNPDELDTADPLLESELEY